MLEAFMLLRIWLCRRFQMIANSLGEKIFGMLKYAGNKDRKRDFDQGRPARVGMREHPCWIPLGPCGFFSCGEHEPSILLVWRHGQHLESYGEPLWEESNSSHSIRRQHAYGASSQRPAFLSRCYPHQGQGWHENLLVAGLLARRVEASNWKKVFPFLRDDTSCTLVFESSRSQIVSHMCTYMNIVDLLPG